MCCGIWHQARDRIHGLDWLVQHIPQMLSKIEICGILTPSQHLQHCSSVPQSIFAVRQGRILLLKDATDIKKYLICKSLVFQFFATVAPLLDWHKLASHCFPCGLMSNGRPRLFHSSSVVLTWTNFGT